MYNPKHWKTTELYIFKRVDFTIHELHVNKALSEKKKIVLPNQALCRAPGS